LVQAESEKGKETVGMMLWFKSDLCHHMNRGALAPYSVWLWDGQSKAKMRLALSTTNNQNKTLKDSKTPEGPLTPEE
jgi:hypothetical protein